MPVKIKSKKNLLDFVPVKNESEKFSFVKNEKELITIVMKRNNPMDKFVRKFIKKTPETFKVDLDEFGTFVLESIDGNKDIFTIGKEVKEKFGEDAEPLYERLGAFMNLLKNNNFIYFKK